MADHQSRLDRRGFIAAAATGAGALAFGHSPALGYTRDGGRPPERPNLVLITADDLGYGDLSGYGRCDYQTVELDRMAAQGTRLTQAYAIAPICTPTRVGLMTGRYPARHPLGLREPLTLTGADRERGLDASQPTLSSLLKQRGYTNGLFGKWHLGIRPEFHPYRHGFDEFFGPLSGVVDYVSHDDPTGAHDLYRGESPVRVDGYLTDILADEATRFIRRAPEPFFLSHQGTAPHSPWQRRGDAALHAEHDGPYDMGPADRYPAMMLALDEAVGRILRALDERGISERTLVIFTSDNGGVRYANMGGLARAKTHLWEGGIRVPAIVRWPGIVPAAVTSRQVASTLDWTATLLAAAGASPDPAVPLDGIDVLPILSGSRPLERRTIFWRMAQRRHQAAVRDGDWKYVRDETGEHLFDLTVDPGERNDLSAADPERLGALGFEWGRWNESMLPPPSPAPG